MAVTLNGLHKDEIYLATPPIAVQKALFALLSTVGKLVGYRDHYPRTAERIHRVRREQARRQNERNG